MEKWYVIYKATSKTSGKSYIGQTIDFKRRKREHLKATGKYHFHRAIRKYGKDGFYWSVIWSGYSTDEHVDNLEISYIHLFNTFYDGYNSQLGGHNHYAGKRSEETKRKIGLANSKYKGCLSSWYGKKHSVESIEKMRQSKLGKKRKPETVEKLRRASMKPIKCIQDNKLYESISNCAEAYEMHPNSIRKSIKLNKCIKGYSFKYITKEE